MVSLSTLVIGADFVEQQASKVSLFIWVIGTGYPYSLSTLVIGTDSVGQQASQPS